MKEQFIKEDKSNSPLFVVVFGLSNFLCFSYKAQGSRFILWLFRFVSHPHVSNVKIYSLNWIMTIIRSYINEAIVKKWIRKCHVQNLQCWTWNWKNTGACPESYCTRDNMGGIHVIKIINHFYPMMLVFCFK